MIVEIVSFYSSAFDFVNPVVFYSSYDVGYEALDGLIWWKNVSSELLLG